MDSIEEIAAAAAEDIGETYENPDEANADDQTDEILSETGSAETDEQQE